jgi:hypothetical protein
MAAMTFSGRAPATAAITVKEENKEKKKMEPWKDVKPKKRLKEATKKCIHTHHLECLRT